MPPSRARVSSRTGAQLADGEGGDEGERVHAAEVGLAVGDVHRSPHEAGAEGCGDAAERMVCRAVAPPWMRAEAEHDGGDDDRDGRRATTLAMFLRAAPSSSRKSSASPQAGR